jgi:Uma2 family endonuclease
MPTLSHGGTQAELAYRFRVVRDSHHLFPVTETRMRLAPDLYRIPDVAVFAGGKPNEEVPSNPPLIAIEIVSPDDRHSELQDKLAEYEKWGVAHIWVVDPGRRSLATYRSGTLATVPHLTLPGYSVEIGPDLFS